jgi:hypothetical protein
MDLRSDLVRGTLLGLVILGIGGRLLMRVVANLEGQAPMWTVGGSVTVAFYGAVSGAFAGLVYYLLRRFVNKAWLRTASFLLICGLVALRGVRGSPATGQVLFMVLALVYLIAVDFVGRRAQRSALNADFELSPRQAGS